jgi:hypothetical protein
LDNEKKQKNDLRREDAKKNLRALSTFKPYLKVPNDTNRMKEAVLSIIGCKLLSDE